MEVIEQIANVETLPEMRKRHELERLRAVHAQMGGTMSQASEVLDMPKSSLDWFLRSRGLRWNRAQLEAAYPEIGNAGHGD